MNDNYAIPNKTKIKKSGKKNIIGYLPEINENSVILHKYIWDKNESKWNKDEFSFKITSELEIIGAPFSVYHAIPMLNTHNELIEMLKRINPYISEIFKSIKTFDNFVAFLNFDYIAPPKNHKKIGCKYCVLQNASKFNYAYRKVVFRFFYIKDHTIVEYARYFIPSEPLTGYFLELNNYGKITTQIRSALQCPDEKSKLINIPSKLINSTKLKYYRDFILPATKKSIDLLCLCNMIESPVVEEIMKSKYTNIIDLIKSELSCCSMEYIFLQIFNYNLLKDEISVKNEQNKSLHQKLGLPAYALKKFDEMLADGRKKNNQILSIIKCIFETNEDILLNMDRNTFSTIFDMTLNLKHTNYYFFDSMKLLISTFGRKNYFSYFLYLCKRVESEDINIYFDYLQTIDKMDDKDIDKKWKFKYYDELINAHNDAINIFNLKQNETYAKRYNESFEKIKDSFKKYEYTGEKFSIVSPKKPVEIFTEGSVLHHCVGSYVDTVCSGKTIILFVRKNDELSRPFFTLEIRDGAVRQCHGFGNKNIGKEEGLTDFIKNYCNEKNIHFTTADRIL